MGDETKMERERETLRLMMGLYCRDRHGAADALCAECGELFEYARKRLATCPFRKNKPTCSECPVHCYRPDMREKVKTVMQYAGPRMIYRHPVLTIRHYWRKAAK